jgi:hypothetical protein
MEFVPPMLAGESVMVLPAGVIEVSPLMDTFT